MSYVSSLHPSAYARELERFADGGSASAAHLTHAEELARALSTLHTARSPLVEDGYESAVRRAFEGQRGLFCSVDGLCRRDRISLREGAALEAAAVGWRWRLRSRGGRLCALAEADPDVLSYPSVLGIPSLRKGEAADDLARVAVRYLALGADDGDAWERSYRPLWNAFFRAYFAASGDAELLDVAPLFFVAEALALAASTRLRRNAEGCLVRFALATVRGDAFDPDSVERFVER